jgi:hypothetical protein
MLAQLPSKASPVAATAAPATLLHTVHSFGASRGYEPAGNPAAVQHLVRQPARPKTMTPPIPAARPVPRAQQPTMAAANTVRPAGHIDATAKAAPASPPPAVTEPVPVTKRTPAAEPARLESSAPTAARAPQPAEPTSATPVPPSNQVDSPPANNGSAGKSVAPAEAAASSSRFARIKDQVVSLALPQPVPPKPASAEPAPRPAAETSQPAPQSQPASDSQSQSPQLRSIRIKVLHGAVARVNAQAGHVVLGFNEPAELAPGTRVQVFRRVLFKRQPVGEVEVVSSQGEQYVARPVGSLKVVQISVEDELVVVP